MPRPAGKDGRPFITVTDSMPEHHKVEPLSDAAFRALVEIWCYCSRNENDGLLTAAVWAKRAKPRVLKELRDAGLAEIVDGGVQMHDYPQHQRTAAEIEEIRSDKSTAGKKGAAIGNHRRHHVAKQKIEPTCEYCVPRTGFHGSAPPERETSAEARHVPSHKVGTASAKVRTESDTESDTQLPVELNPGGHRHETLRIATAPQPPRCIAHKGLPEDQVPPCRGCMVAARNAAADVEVIDAGSALSVRMQIDNCLRCNDTGFVEDPDTHDYIERCDHRPAIERAAS